MIRPVIPTTVESRRKSNISFEGTLHRRLPKDIKNLVDSNQHLAQAIDLFEETIQKHTSPSLKVILTSLPAKFAKAVIARDEKQKLILIEENFRILCHDKPNNVRSSSGFYLNKDETNKLSVFADLVKTLTNIAKDSIL